MGGGKGGGSGHTPREYPDTLKSMQRAQLIDLVCEGPIAGPVDGLESVFLDDTPIQNADGSYNFSGVDIAWREGHQVQEPLPGVADIENEISVSTEVKAGTPLVRTVTNLDVDRVRVTVGVPSLIYMTDEGDRKGAEVDMEIHVGRGGVWELAQSVNIKGKTRSAYTRSYDIYAPAGSGSWQVRVSRITSDSTTDQLQNKTLWYSYTELIDAKMTYPNSAIVGLRFDAEQFQSIPRRNYLIKGLIVRVPANYDPDTRAYSGIWDGSFQLAWTDNPAWVLFDLLTNSRYGMGRALVGFEPDKWRLYEIAQYCDQLVDDGYGGQEPRFTCNLYLTSQRQAHQVVNDLVSVFRGMPVWDGLQLGVNQDVPQDPVWQFNNSNVVEGKFSYQSSSRKSRHSAVRVAYLDPASGWEKRDEYVQDDELVARYGLNELKLTAFGCTSRGQAHRVGRWTLITEKLERQSIAFDVGREGLVCLPGDVIEVLDNQYAGARLGGRVLAVEGNTVTLDAPVTLTADNTNWFHYLDGNSQIQQRQIFSPTEGTTDSLILGDDPLGLTELSTFNISTASLSPRRWRVLGVTENRESGTYSITALQHVPEKHAIIEEGLVFEPLPGSLNGGQLPPIEHLAAELLPESDSDRVRLTWTTPRVIQGIKFDLKLLAEGRVVERVSISTTEYVLRDISEGDYTVEIRAQNAMGQLGPMTDLVFTVAPPRAPDVLQLTPTNFSVSVRPTFDFTNGSGANSLGTRYVFYTGSTKAEVLAKTNLLGSGFVLDHQGLTPDTLYWYGVEAVNAIGRSALVTGSVKTLLQPDDILQVLGNSVPSVSWVQDLESGVVALSDRAALVVNQDGRVSGIAVTAGSQASAVDFLADFVSFTDPDTLERNLYWDGDRSTLVVKGEVRLLDGTTVSSKSDLGNGAGGIFRLKTATGVFPTDDAVTTALFRSSFGTDPGKDTVLTVYAEDGAGVITQTASRMYDGTAWVSPKLFIDGDLIAVGTVKGDRLVARTILGEHIKTQEIEAEHVKTRSLTADKLVSNTITAESGVIAEAAIEEANIKDLSVSTIKIQQNAVTVPVAAYTAGEVTGAKGTWVSIQSASIDSGGSPVNISVRASTANGWLKYRILRNGAPIYTDGGESSSTRSYVTMIWTDFSAQNGICTYTIQAMETNYNLRVKERTLIMLGVMR